MQWCCCLFCMQLLSSTSLTSMCGSPRVPWCSPAPIPIFEMLAQCFVCLYFVYIIVGGENNATNLSPKCVFFFITYGLPARGGRIRAPMTHPCVGVVGGASQSERDLRAAIVQSQSRHSASSFKIIKLEGEEYGNAILVLAYRVAASAVSLQPSCSPRKRPGESALKAWRRIPIRIRACSHSSRISKLLLANLHLPPTWAHGQWMTTCFSRLTTPALLFLFLTLVLPEYHKPACRHAPSRDMCPHSLRICCDGRTTTTCVLCVHKVLAVANSSQKHPNSPTPQSQLIVLPKRSTLCIYRQ